MEFYCPKCGEVRPGHSIWMKGWIVPEHIRCTGEHAYTLCRGGSIDPDKDRVR